MEKQIEVQGKSLDHFGVIASEIRRLKIIDRVDRAIGVNDQEIVTTGECIAGMAMNCFGFLDYPLMLMPEFFEDKALSCLFEKDIDAGSFNRHKLGRVLDSISNYGCEKLFSELSFAICIDEEIGLNFQHCDTTTFSLTGEYLVEDMDVQEVIITRGYSKDQRRDCKQIVQELIVSQDGGVPLLTKSWSGNASDSKIFQARIRELVRIFKKSNELRCLVADSKLYSKENAEYLCQINFITRISSTIKLEGEVRNKALEQNNWTKIDDNYKAAEYPVFHYDFAQRWIVIFSDHAHNRAIKAVAREVKKQGEVLKNELFHLQAKRFSCVDDARKSLANIAKKGRYHTVTEAEVKIHKHYAKKGRPTENNPANNFSYQIIAEAASNQEAIDRSIQRRSCFVLGTNISSEELSCAQVLAAYKQQDKVEKGFAFLKSPSFFASSLFLKSPSRIQALIMVMTLALLMYSVVQRKLRMRLKDTNSTLPNQIKKQTATPTLRWIFQMLQGINYIVVRINGTIQTVVDNITDLRRKIILLFGPEVSKIYKIS